MLQEEKNKMTINLQIKSSNDVCLDKKCCFLFLTRRPHSSAELENVVAT